MNRVLLVSVDMVKELLPINENIDGGYIRPAIDMAQDFFLEETLGTVLTDKLKELVAEGGAIPAPYSTLLDKLSKMLAHYACSYIIENVGAKVANAGVLRTEDEKMYSLSQSEIALMASREIKRGDTYRGRVQRFLIANYSDFPELYGWRSLADLRQQLYSSATSGLWLGGARGRGWYGDVCDRLKNMPSPKKSKL